MQRTTKDNYRQNRQAQAFRRDNIDRVNATLFGDNLDNNGKRVNR